MVLKNLLKKTNISTDLEIASSFVDALLGLLQAKYKAMLFYTRFGIHTFGLKQKIDVIIVNSKWDVVKIKENLPPNRLFFWNPKFNLVMELPKGSIKNSNTKIGDRLKLQTKIAS